MSIKCTIQGIKWCKETFCDGEDTLYFYYIGQYGLSDRITVLDRLTGFGSRDIETGYRDVYGKFWLASGNFDIRYYPELSFAEAIDKIKANANTCRGK